MSRDSQKTTREKEIETDGFYSEVQEEVSGLLGEALQEVKAVCKQRQGPDLGHLSLLSPMDVVLWVPGLGQDWQFKSKEQCFSKLHWGPT